MDARERKKAVELLSDVGDRHNAYKHLRKSICDNMYQDFLNFFLLNGQEFPCEFWAGGRVKITSFFIERNTVYCKCLENPLFGFSKVSTPNVRRLDRVFGDKTLEKYLELSQLLISKI